MMLPPLRSFMEGKHSLARSKQAFTLTFITLSNTSFSMASTGANTGLVAALFTKISTPP